MTFFSFEYLFCVFISVHVYHVYVSKFSLTSNFIVIVHMYVNGLAEARVRVQNLLVILKPRWWPCAVFCTLVVLLSLWPIPNFYSQFYTYLSIVKKNREKSICYCCDSYQILAICKCTYVFRSDDFKILKSPEKCLCSRS